MGCRGELQRKPEAVYWVIGASYDSGKHEGGFRVAGDSGGTGECDDGVFCGVFRLGGVAGASCDFGEHEGGFRVAGDSGGAGECDSGVFCGVFRRGGDRSEDGCCYPYSESW